LGSCVSKQKYNSLIQARDNLELKATDYSVQLAQERTKALNLQSKYQDLTRQLMQNNAENQRMTRELDQLQRQESTLATDYQELSLKYEDMRGYFDIVLNECDKDKIQVARKERLLDQRQDSIDRSNADLVRTEQSLIQREQKVMEWEQRIATQSDLIESIYTRLNQDLSNLLSTQFTIARADEGVRIIIDEPVLFETGSLEITDYGQSALEQMAVALNAQNDIYVTVIGHTDRNRISKKAKYLTDNWDLSVLKAAAITRALTEAKLDPTIVTASGRGSIAPMVSNSTAEGREKNKRSEIIVTPANAGLLGINQNQNAD
jgi:chemotaxis protein MotB